MRSLQAAVALVGLLGPSVSLGSEFSAFRIPDHHWHFASVSLSARASSGRDESSYNLYYYTADRKDRLLQSFIDVNASWGRDADDRGYTLSASLLAAAVSWSSRTSSLSQLFHLLRRARFQEVRRRRVEDWGGDATLSVGTPDRRDLQRRVVRQLRPVVVRVSEPQ